MKPLIETNQINPSKNPIQIDILIQLQLFGFLLRVLRSPYQGWASDYAGLQGVFKALLLFLFFKINLSEFSLKLKINTELKIASQKKLLYK